MLQALRGKRVFVTGHTGFKGSWLCESLLALGASVTGFSLPELKSPSLFERLQLKDRVTDLRGDIRNYAKFKEALENSRPDLVFHLAAQAIVRHSYKDPKSHFDTNVGGTVNVLEALRHSPSVQAAVFIASDKVYQNNDDDRPFLETDPLGGHDPYSSSKACAELVVHSYTHSFFQNSTLQLASVRSGNVLGGGDWGEQRLVPDCVRAWSQGEVVTIRQPSSIRPWQHVLEPLSAYLCLAARLLSKDKACHGQAFNIGPPLSHQCSVAQILEEFQRHWPSAKVKLSETQETMKEAKILKLSNEKAQRILSWSPSLSFEDTIHWTARWYRDDLQKDHRGMVELTQSQVKEYFERARSKKQSWAPTIEDLDFLNHKAPQ